MCRRWLSTILPGGSVGEMREVGETQWLLEILIIISSLVFYFWFDFSLWHHPCKYWIYLQMKFTTFSLLISFLPPHSQRLECHVQFKLGVTLQGPGVRMQELNPQLLGFYLIPDRLCSWGISQTTFPPQRKICLWTLTLTFLWSCKITNPILAFSSSNIWTLSK